MSRNRHDRARPVAGQHVVGDPDRDPGAVHRVDRRRADRHAGLLALGGEALDLRRRAGSCHVCLDLGAPVRRGQPGDERVLRRQHHERRPEQRVGSRREDAQVVAARLVVVGRGGEDDLGALGPTDPVRLHDPDGFGPVEAVEVEELVGVLRDPQEPLGQVALLDLRAAAPAAPLDTLDLLPGQGAVVGAPVDRRRGAVGQPPLQEAQEQPLVPAVVRRVAGDDLRRPVERRPHAPKLAAHVVDVLVGPGCRVDLLLDRGVLGRQAEGVEAHREEHVVAPHPVIAGDRVGRRLDVPVPDVEIPRRVVVHGQQVVLGPGRVSEVRPIQVELCPARLPARLDRRGVVALDPGPLGGHDLASGMRNNPPPHGRGVASAALVRGLVELRGFEPRTF